MSNNESLSSLSEMDKHELVPVKKDTAATALSNYLQINAKFKERIHKRWFRKTIIDAKTQAQHFLIDLNKRKQVVTLDSLIWGNGFIPYAGIIYYQNPKEIEHPVFGRIYEISVVIAGPQEYLNECIEQTVLDETCVDSELIAVDTASYTFIVSSPYQNSVLNLVQKNLEQIASKEKCDVSLRTWNFVIPNKEEELHPNHIQSYWRELSVCGSIMSVLTVKERIYPTIQEHILQFSPLNKFTSFRELSLEFYLKKS